MSTIVFGGKTTREQRSAADFIVLENLANYFKVDGNHTLRPRTDIVFGNVVKYDDASARLFANADEGSVSSGLYNCVVLEAVKFPLRKVDTWYVFVSHLTTKDKIIVADGRASSSRAVRELTVKLSDFINGGPPEVDEIEEGAQKLRWMRDEPFWRPKPSSPSTGPESAAAEGLLALRGDTARETGVPALSDAARQAARRWLLSHPLQSAAPAQAPVRPAQSPSRVQAPASPPVEPRTTTPPAKVTNAQLTQMCKGLVPVVRAAAKAILVKHNLATMTAKVFRLNEDQGLHSEEARSVFYDQPGGPPQSRHLVLPEPLELPKDTLDELEKSGVRLVFKSVCIRKERSKDYGTTSSDLVACVFDLVCDTRVYKFREGRQELFEIDAKGNLSKISK